ncbi:deleted in malignant brain tumors 1 protein-like [Neoarius graeffei]|uniref:deleted in malignant brain tumors 1 protein-like n=1 Tax=Neoarius graeffei TaxID=443677 RepID=UPI00298C7F0E|nr:deleted in malignant brain tumors 1 protein-like [Neoarius graeffei]
MFSVHSWIVGVLWLWWRSTGSSVAFHEGRVRLSGGSKCQGEVEIYFRQDWRRVLLDSWSLSEASVLCRQLGCGSVLNYRSSPSTTEHKHMCVTGFSCSGTEAHLGNCSSTQPVNCSSGEQLYITCSAPRSIRLVGSGGDCAGRLEVFHSGSWGTVCDDSWDIEDAQVVCRQLQCGEALSTHIPAWFGPGTGPVWLNEVECEGKETSLWNCRYQLCEEGECGHQEDVGVVCSGTRMSQLQGGWSLCSGGLEVYHNATWGSICDDQWNIRNAQVVCRQLGCGSALRAERNVTGSGEETIWLNRVKCRGDEIHLWDCHHSLKNHTDCSHAGVTCAGHTGARLVNGPDSCSGRVELQYLSEWGTVCAVSWDMRAADVLCAQLNCGTAVAVVEVDWFGEGIGHIWADVFDCQGNETHLSQCGISSWSRAACSHQHDAGVICNGSSMAFHEGRVRLSGGSECQGEVEIYFRQDWRRVLLDSWSLSEASVLCRQLGCGSVLNYRSSPSTTEHKHMCVTGFSCSGTEAHLGKCSSAQPVNCNFGEEVYITCSGKFNPDPRSIRLVGSGGDCAGRLEVFHSGSWGTVCDGLWDIEDAQVVCRQLQCGEALSTYIPAWFGPGTGSIWLNEVECEGNETSLWNCRFQRCEEGKCGHQEDVGVVCSEFKEIRLTEGCEGNLEVFYNGTWGNVCHNQMDDETVNMVCRELNCGRRGSLSNTAARVKSAPNWLDNLKCRKHDSNLWQCPSSPWGQNSCNNLNEVAHITCTGGWIQTSGSVHCHKLQCFICSSFPSQKHCSKRWSLRLRGDKGSCSGRLEVYHNATWGSICDDQWNDRNAQVVCRQLGCGSALRAERNVPGSGEGTIWLNRVKCRGDEIHLWDCHHSLKKRTDCSHAGVTCAGSVRLVNGGSRCAGRVEVLQDGQWGTVCGVGWDLNDAAVVCGELGCGEPVNAPQYGYFGPGSGPIWLVGVQCRGSESTLKNCRSYGRGEQYGCHHGGDAGVTCSGRGSRLSAGPHRCSGRVEVFHGGSWSTVCDADFDQQDAEVVCRELGCGIPVEVLGSAAFGRGEGQVWTEELQCRGNESEITFCPTSSSLKHSTCSHDNDVGLKCSAHTGARLVNGPDSCSGRVELQYLSEWGTVCAVSWDMRVADVLCAQLDCGSAVAVVEVDWFGKGSGLIWADVFDCQGNETHLSQCGVSSWSRAACSHQHDAGVICNGSSVAFHEGRVRLSGGSECQGEVEIYFRQDWRRVLLDSWSLSEASVVCRQLGCGSVLNYRSSPSTTEHKYMCVTGFSCSGTEAHLGNCSRAQNVSCSSGEQLYITCSDPRSIRLVGSGGDCAGRLEVFHSGSWGTVCDDSWDIEDAQVVCRQLQCGEALSTHIPAWFGPGTGSIWLNEVECEGNEMSLWNCRFQRCEEGECGHQEDVGVVCSEFKEIRLTEGCEGNLEVFYNGSWGNVCHNQMDDETGNMVCRELNCGRRGSLSNTAARVKSAPNWLDHLKCRKHDSNLWQCPSSPWGQNRCDNGDEVVHITCTGGWIQAFLLLSVAINCKKCSSFPSQKHCSKHWSLRLRGDKGSCSGGLEVYHNATWGSICDDQWNVRNAQVVCRQLGCGSALRAERNVPGPGEGTIWLNRVKCRGDEIHLWDCHHSLKKHTDCSHAGVTCAEFKEIRLTEGCEGNLEVFYNGTWGNVCHNQMDDETVNMVCRELNCGRRGSLSNTAARVKSAPNWLDHLKCRKPDSNLWQCPSSPWGQNRCDNGDEVVHITCTGGWIQTFLLLSVAINCSVSL